MPSRQHHDTFGALTGLLVASVDYLLAEQTPTIAGVLASAGGGALGARLPDLLEPATCSWHRSTMHSMAALAGVGYLGATNVREFGRCLRDAKRESGTNEASALREQVIAHLCAGAAVGVAAGYVSHLAADAATPRGVPLLTRGF